MREKDYGKWLGLWKEADTGKNWWIIFSGPVGYDEYNKEERVRRALCGVTRNKGMSGIVWKVDYEDVRDSDDEDVQCEDSKELSSIYFKTTICLSKEGPDFLSVLGRGSNDESTDIGSKDVTIEIEEAEGPHGDEVKEREIFVASTPVVSDAWKTEVKFGFEEEDVLKVDETI